MSSAACQVPVHTLEEDSDFLNSGRVMPSSPLGPDLLHDKEENFPNEPSQNPLLMTMTLQPFSASVSQAQKNRSHSSSSGPACRICHEGDTSESLLCPCECLGSLATVHQSCLEKWLSTSSSTHCEICKFHYNIIRSPRPVWHWFRTHGLRDQSHGFYGDILCLLILAPLCLVSVYLCGVGASVYMKYGIWEGTGLAMLCCFLMGTFLLWCAVTVRFHWKMINDWRRTHQVVHLVFDSRRAFQGDSTTTQNKEISNVDNPEDNQEVIQVPVIEIQ